MGQRRGGIGFLRIAAILCAVAGPAGAALSAENLPAASSAGTSDAAKLQQLNALLADPAVRTLLAERLHAAPPPAAPLPDAQPMMATTLAQRLQTTRAHLLSLAGAAQGLGGDAASARSMVGDALGGRSGWSLAAFLAVFVALGFAAEMPFRLALRPGMRWLLGLTLDTAEERVRAVFARFGYGVGLIACFALGSIGAFLLFDWPAAVTEVLLGYLIVFLGVRLASVVGRMLLAPGAMRFRVVPITTAAAVFLHRRWLVMAALVGIAAQTIAIFRRFGLSPAAGDLLGDVTGLVLLALGLETLWRCPPASLRDEGLPPSFVARHRRALAGAGSLVLIVLWVLWLVGTRQAFWLLAFAAGLPITIMTARRSVEHILRPPGAAASPPGTRSLDVVVFERGIRAVVIVTAALLLGRILDVDFTSLTMDDTLLTRVVRGATGIVVIALLADVLWHLAKAMIDHKLAASLPRGAGDDDAAHAARLKTLLPIVRNILLVVIVVVAGMMMLSAAGIEIGPLIASAGVVGVAIGFGAQTLVKDIISGIFYLLDDAFRVGEYIQSGSYKGTVESFSLRSVKLRHQRGALYTVPFGILGAVQNQSRDWVVDKIVLNVPYGTDLDRVRRIIKKIGETLVADEEFASGIINPIKMQGVVQFGDYAIQIQTKMMTRPGDIQFMARRRALIMINAAFAEHGISFATPVVHVAGGPAAAAEAGRLDGAVAGAAARTGLALGAAERA